MVKHARLTVAAVLALGALTTGVGSASAGRLSVSAGFFRMVWTNGTFRLYESSSTAVAECEVTLEGLFHLRTMAKVTSVLIGLIDGATMGTCRGHTAGFLTETLPWHIQYEAYSGTLPRIERLWIQITEAVIWRRAGIFGSRCLARANATNQLKMGIGREPTSGRLLQVQMFEAGIPYISGCIGLSLIPESLPGEFLPLNGTERLTLTLI